MNVVTMQYIRAMEFLRTLRDREEGQGLVEYALILAAIAIGAVVILGEIGGDITTAFETVRDELAGAL
jgi:pilus assembly protein Flp/PilA